MLYPPARPRSRTPTRSRISVWQGFAQTNYVYYDADNDGYSPRDPVVHESAMAKRRRRSATGDVIVIGANAVIPNGATLTAFAADEFWAEASGEVNGLEPTDWIFRENELTGTNGGAQPLAGLVGRDRPARGELPRQVDRDRREQRAGRDHLHLLRRRPSRIRKRSSWCGSTPVLPNTNITTLTLPDGSTIDVSAMAVPPYINGNTKWMKITADG